MFDLIQKLNANYLKILDVECLSIFINILKLFMKLTNSRNYRYVIIEYFYTISDIVSKRFTDNTTLWIQLFSFLDINSEEKDPEIRNTSLNIFAGIITNHGNEFSIEIWQYIMEDIYLRSFDNTIEIYFHLLREELPSKMMPDTPAFVKQMKNDYELNNITKKKDSKLKMITKEDLETISLQWQETVKVLIMTFNRIITKYLTYPNKDKEIINKMFEKSFYLFRITSKSIFNEVTSVINILLKSDAVSKSKKVTLFLEIEKWMKRNKNQSQAVHDIMNIVMMIFEDEDFLSETENFSIILKIYSQIAYYSSFADEYSTYFYNLNLMCKKFMTNLISFVLVKTQENDLYLKAFLDNFEMIIMEKVINDKANLIAVGLLQALLETVKAKSSKISTKTMESMLETFFNINKKGFDEEYHKFVSKEKNMLYFCFYEELNAIVEDFIQNKNNEMLIGFIDTMLNKFVLINRIKDIKNIKQLTPILQQEYKLTTRVVYYFLDLFKENHRELQDIMDKVFIYNKVFKHNIALLEKEFQYFIEKDVDSGKNFSGIVNDYLKSYLKIESSPNFKYKTLRILAENLDFNLTAIRDKDEYTGK